MLRVRATSFRDLGYRERRRTGGRRRAARRENPGDCCRVGRLSIMSCSRSRRPSYLPASRVVVVVVGRLSSLLLNGGSSSKVEGVFLGARLCPPWRRMALRIPLAPPWQPCTVTTRVSTKAAHSCAALQQSTAGAMITGSFPGQFYTVSDRKLLQTSFCQIAACEAVSHHCDKA